MSALDDALALLEIDAEADEKTARRAYLRLLRRFRPERDPEGFRRLREAYERVIEHLERRADPVPELEIWSLAAVGSGDAEDRAPVPQETGPPVEWTAARIEELGFPVGAEHLELARECLDHHPDSASAISLWATVLQGAGRDDEAVAALRAGISRGRLECWDTLAARFPSELAPDEWTAWVPGADAEVLVEASHALLLEGEPERAHDTALEALGRVARRADRLDLLRGLLRLALRFDLQDHGDAAEELWDRVDEELSLGDTDHPRWREILEISTMVHELRRLPTSFPSSLRKAVATSILNGRPEEAGDAMHEYALSHPSLAPGVAEQLNDAPMLHFHYHHLLSGPESTNYAEGPGVAFPFAGFLVFLVIVLRDCGGG